MHAPDCHGGFRVSDSAPNVWRPVADAGRWATLVQIRALFAFVVLLGSTSAYGAGWQDYELPIAPGYSVVHLNSIQICIESSTQGLVGCADPPNSNVGPLTGYIVQESVIATRHIGLTPGSLPNPAREWFYLLERGSDKVVGPMDKQAYLAHPLHPASANWTEPHNPNFWLPLVGTLLILAFWAWYSVWPVVIFAIALLTAIYLLSLKWRRRVAQQPHAAIGSR
jgi:hypothetical protein